MLKDERVEASTWTLPKKILFRFFFIYFVLYISPWDWFEIIPGVSFILKYYHDLFEWLVITANYHLFQVFGVKNVQQVFNGSGDTSYQWAANVFILAVAAMGCLIWSLADGRRKSYNQLNYLLCLLVRYSLVLIAFSYGFNKVFMMQMGFPLQSQLATPLGDFLPMRFSWLFIGYSGPYQVFSGIMEVLVGVLLLWRRTATLGALVATAVFINVMMLNLCYDIPVKLFSINIVIMCFYLLANEYKRIACFFILNRTAPLCGIYNFELRKKWMRVTRIILKLGILFLVGRGVWDTWNFFKETQFTTNTSPVKPGMYNVNLFVINQDTLPPLLTDTTRWQDVIFEENNGASIKTSDTAFRRRYGRSYFSYTIDSVTQTLSMKKFPQDAAMIGLFKYRFPDSNTIILQGKKHNDSLYVELKKSNRHFQLAEKQFHWLSEANR